MNRIGSYLRKLREEHQLEQRALAEMTGIGSNTISSHENGHTEPSYGTRKLYAQAYGMTIDEFETGWRQGRRPNNHNPAPGKLIPVINKAPAGKPHDYEEPFPESGIGHEYIDKTPGLEGESLFAFVVIGDSMVPAFLEGDYVVCCWAEADDIQDGEPVFVRLGSAKDHRCTFKRAYRIDRERVELRADNHRYNPEIVAKTDIDRMAPVIEWRRRTGRKPKCLKYETA